MALSRRERRIASRFRPVLPEIADILAACGGNMSAAAREANAIPGCEALNSTRISAWLRNPEFAALYEQAQIAVANARRAAPELRAPRDLAWLQKEADRLKSIVDEAAEAIKAGEKGPHKLTEANARRALMATLEEIRAQEKHVADWQDRQRRREFARFIVNWIEWVKVKHARSADVVVPVLRSSLGSLDQIVKGVPS